MKKLGELCLICIGEHLDSIPAVSRYLATVHKELLLEYLVHHDCLKPGYLPHITYNLFSSSMKSLNLYNCEQVSDVLLRQLCSVQCQLKNIKVQGCVQVTDKGVQALTLKQSEMESLQLVKLPHLTSKGLVNVLSSHLTVLSLRGCTSITSDGLHHVLQKNRGIRELNLCLCNGLDDKVFGHIATCLSHGLESLDATGLHFISDSSAQKLAQHCPNLKSLKLHGCNRITSVGMGDIFQHCTSLHELDLSYCVKLQSVPHCEVLRNIPSSMQTLSLCGVMVGDGALLVDVVTRLPRLAAVRLCGIPALTDDTLAQILQVIGPHLEQLDLSGSILSPITDCGLAQVARYCLQLSYLALSLMRNITGVSLLPWLQNAETASNVTGLSLSCKKLDASVLDALASNCCNLEHLDLAGVSFVDDLLLTRLADNCPKLSFLSVKGCRQVSDSGVVAVARRCPLRHLVLSGCNQVTDASIFALANSCPHLDEIYLNGCANVSPIAVEYLKDQVVPRLWFCHKTPNAAPDLLMARNVDTNRYCQVAP